MKLRRYHWLGLAVIFLALGMAGRIARAQDVESQPSVHVYIFGSEDCAVCKELYAQCDRLGPELDCRIVVHRYNTDVNGEYERLVAMEERYGEQASDLPVLFVGKHMLSGEDAGKRLEAVLRQLVAAGGGGELDVPEPGGATEAPVGEKDTVYLAYFRKPGCTKCSRVERMLEVAQQRNPGLEVKSFVASRREAYLLREVLCERAGVSEDARLTEPAVFVGREALIGDAITADALQALIARHAGAEQSSVAEQEPVWDASESELDTARQRLVSRFRNVAFVSVIVGGLVDSINPCAFATLVFFITYLATLRRTGRDVLIVGGAFTCGVFIAYLVLGLGLSEVIVSLDALPRVAAFVTWGIIALTFALAVVSFYDFILAVRGRPGQMALKLPKAVRMRINRVITKRLRVRTIAASAFGLGLIVSLLELACTGQVYFPLIKFMNMVGVDRARVLLLLGIYNIAFVAPLILIIGCAGLGMSTDRLGSLLKKQVAPVKLIMA
ncbi:MAG: hypothetical protein GY700_01090, partial [Propionibacteriaceae bacterium]|nr:hypothetical protein [Propionibacteriaceae bacterium]